VNEYFQQAGQPTRHPNISVWYPRTGFSLHPFRPLGEPLAGPMTIYGTRCGHFRVNITNFVTVLRFDTQALKPDELPGFGSKIGYLKKRLPP